MFFFSDEWTNDFFFSLRCIDNFHVNFQQLNRELRFSQQSIEEFCGVYSRQIQFLQGFFYHDRLKIFLVIFPWSIDKICTVFQLPISEFSRFFFLGHWLISRFFTSHVTGEACKFFFFHSIL